MMIKNKDRKSKELEHVQGEEEVRENMIKKSEGNEEDGNRKEFKKVVVGDKSGGDKSDLAEKTPEGSEELRKNFDIVGGKQHMKGLTEGKFEGAGRKEGTDNPKYVHESQKIARWTDTGRCDEWKRSDHLKQTRKLGHSGLAFINDCGTQINVWGNASKELLARLDHVQQHTQVVCYSSLFFFL